MSVAARTLVCVLACAGCGPTDHLLAVELRTDLVAGIELSAVRVRFSTGAAHLQPAFRGEDYTGGRRVAEEYLPAGTYGVELELLDDAGNAIVRRPVIVELRTSRVVVVVVTRDCRGVTCPRDGDDALYTACLRGRCVDPRCTADDPELCGDASRECEVDEACRAVAACAVARCASGTCLLEGRDELCGATEYCHPTRGCRSTVVSVPSCGDGVVHPEVEECDDGNTLDGDGCSSSCLRCDEGAASFTLEATGHCYWRSSQSLAWGESDTACQATGGTLVAYSSAAELEAVRAALVIETSHYIGRFFWGRGRGWVTWEDTTYANWAPGEPSIGTNVVHQRGDGTWAESSGWGPMRSICEKHPWRVDRATGHAYRWFVPGLSWDDADAACRTLGGYLAAPTSSAELAFLGELPPRIAWIGLSDRTTEGEHAWTTGEPLAFANWAEGEPNDDAVGVDEDCVWVTRGGGWADADCAQVRPYLCEIEP